MIIGIVFRNSALSAIRAFVGVVGSAALLVAQNAPSTGTATSVTGFINPAGLPDVLAGALEASGGRMTNANNAELTIAGTITDSNGSRPAQIVVQAPGYLSYREGQAKALTFDGVQFKSKDGQLTSDDERVSESLLAHLPDSVFLQMAAGGSIRPIGSHFRTDDGKTPNYRGPFWTLFGFSPGIRQGLTSGQAMQQELFIAIDEHTGLISEIRVATQQNVTQTQFSNWTQQQGNQWFPNQIVRLENGKQTLSFQVGQASVGPVSAAPSAFEP